MRCLSLIFVCLPLIGAGLGCQKKSSSDPEPPPPPVTLGDGTPVPEPPSTPPPTSPEPTDPVAPGSPDAPIDPDPLTPPDEPVVNPPIEPGTPPVSPTEPPVEGPPEPLPPPTELRIKENQFWVFEGRDDELTFNFPWDEAEGDAIIRDETLVPAYARSCLEAARSTYESLAIHPDFQARMKPLLARGVTQDLTFLVVVSPSDDDRTALRRQDRDAYFWHWTDPAKKPVLSMNQYEKGSWVWEVIATPDRCVQPVVREIGRMFDWTSRRLSEKESSR